MNTEEMLGRVREENQVLREQNAGLVEQNATLRQLIGELGERNAELRQGLAAAEERIAELEQAKKRPPSFIKPSKPKCGGAPEPRRKRAKEGNHARRRAETVTRREEHHIERCPECACKLRKERMAWHREVIDLPPAQAAEVTEHVVFKGYCPKCAAWKYAERCKRGEVVGRRRFGTRLMALIGYLSESLRLPQDAIRSYLKTMHGVEVSAGAIADVRRGLAEKLKPTVEDLKAQIRSSAIVHADETGWREDGQNGYVWVFSTPGKQGIRYYVYDHSRGQQVVEGVLGEEYRGVLGSDFYGAYNVYTGPHQRCWVHLLGDLRDLKEEHAGDSTVQNWAQELRALYDRAQAFVKAGAHTQQEKEALYIALWHEVSRLGLLYAQAEHPCRALAKRVLRHQDELFQFVLVVGLAADNNLAERSLRPLVVVRKISGGTRSTQGSQTRMTLASIIATLTARGLNPFSAFLDIIRANCCA